MAAPARRVWASAVAVGAVALAVYLLTLAPTVALTDSGELTVAASTLGIAHPPGLPLYVLLGWLFSRLPLGTVALAFLWLSSMLRRADTSGTRASRRKAPESPDRLAAAGFAALCLAFGLTLWNWATVAEVYALQMVLLVAMLWSFFAAMRSGAVWMWGLAGLFFGLGLANHHVMTLLFVPGLLVFFLAARHEQKVVRRGWALAAGGAVLGLALYLYLPLRASQAPFLNWGNPVNLLRFWWHVTGRQYQVNLFSVPLSTLMSNLVFGLRLWWNQFTPLGLLVALFGLVTLWRRDRGLAIFTLVVVAADVLFAAHYDIAEDSDAYYLPTFLMTAVWLAWGAYAALAWLRERRWTTVGWSALTLVVALNLSLHWQSSDKRHLWLVHDYAVQALSELEPSATLLTRDWQVYSPLLYLQHVEGVRTDARIIDVELMRRTWYLDYLARQYPDLMARCQAELGAYRQQLVLFEYGRPYDAQTIQERYIALLNALIREGQPAHTSLDMETGVGSGYVPVPLGVTIALRKTDTFEPFDTSAVVARGLTDGSIHVDTVVQKVAATYATMRAYRGVYLAQHGRAEEALLTWGEAANLDAGLSLPHRLAGDLYAQMGRVAEARAAYLQALAVNPRDVAAQQGLAAVGGP
jgi:tetratricopeptide (TPR) repeat protein